MKTITITVPDFLVELALKNPKYYHLSYMEKLWNCFTKAVHKQYGTEE